MKKQLDILKKSTELALPLILFRSIDSASFFISNIMLAHVSNTALEASPLIAGLRDVTNFILRSSLTILGHTIPKKSRSNPEEVGTEVQQGFIVATIIGSIELSIYLLAKPIYQGFGQDGLLVNDVKDYFNYFAFSAFGDMWFSVLRHLYSGIDKPWAPFAANVVGAVSSKFLAYGLGYGKFGMPNLGVKGIAIGDALDHYIATASLLGIMYYHRDALSPYSLTRYIPGKHKERFLFILKYGSLISTQVATEILSLYTILLVAGAKDKDNLLLLQVPLRYIFYYPCQRLV